MEITKSKAKVPTLRQQIKALLNEKDELPGGSYINKNGIKITIQKRCANVGYKKPDSWNAEFTIVLDKRLYKHGDLNVKASVDAIHSQRIPLEDLTIEQVVEGDDKFQAENRTFRFHWDAIEMCDRFLYIKWSERKKGKMGLIDMISYTKVEFDVEYAEKQATIDGSKNPVNKTDLKTPKWHQLIDEALRRNCRRFDDYPPEARYAIILKDGDLHASTIQEIKEKFVIQMIADFENVH